MTQRQIHSHWICASGAEGGRGNESALFPYWSFSKTVIATCALMLADQQILSLDSPVAGQDFTLRDLLAHTSGLPDYGSLDAYHIAVAAGDAPWTRDDLVERTLAQGRLFSPGQGWSYSNVGYLFAREIIEAATDQPLGDVVTDLICKPLGLGTVRYWASGDMSSDLHWDRASGYDPGWVYHGCLVGSARGAARLLHALLQGSLLMPGARAQLLHRHPVGGPLPGRPWMQCGYGLGLMSGEMRGVGQALGHSGAGPFCVNAVYHFPDLIDPITVASFTDGTDEGVAEFAAHDIAASRMPP